MRRDYVVSAALLLLGLISAIVLAAQVSSWFAVPVVAFVIALFAADIGKWKASEANYRGSLRIRRAGLAEAEQTRE